MTNSKLSASSIVASSIFMMHLVNGTKLLNATCVAWRPMIVISPITRM